MTLAEKIFTPRKKNGLSQDELAQELGVTRQAVYKWESGNASPEIDKLKVLAKLFSVSFDYLLNDDIDDFDNDKDKSEGSQKKIAYRSVFCTGNKQNPNQADIDHGYIEQRKKKTGLSDVYFARRRKVAEETMKRAGATEITFMSVRETTAFFYDDVRKAVGFYYGASIALVCPIENLAGFSFHGGGANMVNSRTTMLGVSNVGFGIGSMPSTKIMGNMPIKATLMYHDGDNIKEFPLSFEPYHMYYAYNFDCQIELVEMVQNINCSQILESLGKIQIKMDAFRENASTLVVSDTPDVDVEFYSGINVMAANEYSTYRQKLLDEINGVKYVPPKSNKAPDPAQQVPQRAPSADEIMYKIGSWIFVILIAVGLCIIYASNSKFGTYSCMTTLLGLIPAFVAKKKGKGLIVWWLYGMAVFPIAFFHSIVILRPNGEQYVANDEISIPLCVLSAILPIFGVIYGLIKKGSAPERARACGIAALAGFITALIFLISTIA
jgi:transcriptional regulator with XRE-family HTH domain